MRKPNRPFRPPSPESMANAALAYLSRFATSEKSSRRVLENRIRRASMRIPAFAEDKSAQEKLRETIEKLIEKHKKTGALNDVAYAETKVNSLRRAGRSARAIRQKLGHAGVDQDIVMRALHENEEHEEADTELKAARELARRRKLGIFRKGEADLSRQRKDLAALARAGFTLAIARKALAPADGD